MVASGVLLLLVGGSRRPSLTVGLMGRLFVSAIVLAASAFLAIDTATWTGLVAIAGAVVVSLSPRWRRLDLEHPQGQPPREYS
jgi:hypothetical protein